jgi:hypothetical protein
MEMSKYINGPRMAAIDKKSMMYEVSFYKDGRITHITKCFTEQEAENIAEDFVRGSSGPTTLLNESISNG